MPEPAADNALRLREFLLKVRAFRAGDGNAAFGIWADFFGFGQDDPRLLATMLEIGASVADLRRDLALTNNEAFDFVDDHLAQVETIFTMPRLVQPWSSIMPTLHEGVMVALQSLNGAFLAAGLSGGAVPEATIDGLRADVAAMQATIRNTTDLDEPLRAYLLERLGDLAHALDMYPYRGVAALRDWLEVSVGEWVVQSERDPGRHLWDLAGRVATVITIATGMQALPSATEHPALPTPVVIEVETPAPFQLTENTKVVVNLDNEGKPSAAIIDTPSGDPSP